MECAIDGQSKEAGQAEGTLGRGAAGAKELREQEHGGFGPTYVVGEVFENGIGQMGKDRGIRAPGSAGDAAPRG